MRKRTLIAAFVPGLLVLSLPVTAQQGFFVQPLVERKVTELPSGDLFWTIATFDTRDQAQQGAGSHGLVAEYDGKVWLFTLGGAGQAPKGGTKVADIGPVPQVSAREYRLRVNEGGGPQGSTTATHTHPGSEAFYVLRGGLSQKTPHGVARLGAGQSMVGHGSDTPMVVSNSGSEDLREVDASKPFSSPARFD